MSHLLRPLCFNTACLGLPRPQFHLLSFASRANTPGIGLPQTDDKNTRMEMKHGPLARYMFGRSVDF